jgi:hypothetical protein
LSAKALQARALNAAWRPTNFLRLAASRVVASYAAIVFGLSPKSSFASLLLLCAKRHGLGG